MTLSFITQQMVQNQGFFACLHRNPHHRQNNRSALCHIKGYLPSPVVTHTYLGSTKQHGRGFDCNRP